MSRDLHSEGDRDPIEEAIRDAIEAKLAAVRTCIPGEILEYDQGEQRAKVDLAVNSRRKDPETGEEEVWRPDPIPNVPVAFPSSSGYSITWPLEKGDTVEIVFAHSSIDGWLTDGGKDIDPVDPRHHDLSDAIARPTLRSFADALASDRVDSGALVIAADDEIHLGKAAPDEWVAIAKLVEDRLQAIEDYLAKHEHYYTQPSMPAGPTSTQKSLGSGSNPSSSPDPNAPSTNPDDTASSKVKASSPDPGS